MTAISVANIDWLAISSIKTSLADATIDGKRVWATVTVATSIQQAQETQLRNNTPVACIVYDDTEETDCVENVQAMRIRLTLILAAQLRTANDESARVQEGLRLSNAAKNAVENDLPATSTRTEYASAWGFDGYYQPAIEWGTPTISTPTDSERSPWVLVNLPVIIGAVITSQTSH